MRTLLKWTLYAGAAVLLWALETACGMPQTLFGAGPDRLSVLAVCAACLEGPRPGAVLGILAGALRGTVSEPDVLLTPLTFTAAYLAGRLTASRLRPSLPAAAALSLPPVLLTAAYRGLMPLFRGGAAAVTPLYLAGAALHGLMSAAVLWPLCRLAHRLTLSPEAAGR